MKKCLFGLEENMASALAYVGLFVTGVLVFALERENKTVRFHALQSIVTFGVLFIVNFVVRFLLGWIPLIGGLLTGVFSLLIFVSWAYLTYMAYKGATFKVPVVGDACWTQVHKE